MSGFIEIRLNKTIVYLKNEEIHELLLNDIEMFKRGIARGKAFTRANSLQQRYEAKKGDYERLRGKQWDK